MKQHDEMLTFVVNGVFLSRYNLENLSCISMTGEKGSDNVKHQGLNLNVLRLAVAFFPLLLAGCRSENLALMSAIDRQEVGNVRRLLESGARADLVPNGDHRLPLEAAAEGGNDEIVKMLIRKGAKPDSARGERSPLWICLENGHQTAAIALVDAGASVNGPIRNGIAPFYFAIMQKDTHLITKMVAHDADLYAPGPWGSPLHEAADNGDLPSVILLVANGVDINRRNDFGETPIFRALDSGSLEVATYLAAQGADLNAQNRLGSTILHELAETNRAETIVLACSLGADPNLHNIIGESPLHRAAEKGNLAAVKVLVESCRSDIQVRAQHGLSPTGLAFREGHTAVVEYLAANGGRLR